MESSRSLIPKATNLQVVPVTTALSCSRQSFLSTWYGPYLRPTEPHNYPLTTARSPYQPSASIFAVKSSINRTMRHKLKKNKIVMRTIEVKKTPKEPRWVIDPETGEKVSRTFLAMKNCRKMGGFLEVVDMDAVLE